jgi:hypothetical protein
MNPNEIDEPLGTELEMHYENNQQLYRTVQSWALNFKRKQKRGVYNHDLAVQGIANNFIPMVIRSYKIEYGQIGQVSRATKYWMAERMVKYLENEKFEL